MKGKIISILASVFCGYLFLANVNSISTSGAYIYKVQDAVNLQYYLINKSANDSFKDKPYDLNNDGIWNVFDLCQMERKLMIPPEKDNDTLVVYFSRTGNTEKVADYIVDITDADSYEIQADVPYTDEDIDYTNSSCRANKEQNDETVRPEIAEPIESIENYDVIYLGYPIWWGEEPRIIDTFLENYDFSDKTVIPFCTSASSGIETSESNIKNLVKIGNQLKGKRFSSNATKESVNEWIEGLNISDTKSDDKIYLTINETKISAILENNSSAKALKEKLAEKDIIIDAHDYGNFEKVGSLGFSLTTNDTQITTQAGDLILYQGNSFVLYYDENSWNFTKLGHVENITQSELKSLLGDGDVKITLSLK